MILSSYYLQHCLSSIARAKILAAILLLLLSTVIVSINATVKTLFRISNVRRRKPIVSEALSSVLGIIQVPPETKRSAEIILGV